MKIYIKIYLNWQQNISFLNVLELEKFFYINLWILYGSVLNFEDLERHYCICHPAVKVFNTFLQRKTKAVTYTSTCCCSNDHILDGYIFFDRQIQKIYRMMIQQVSIGRIFDQPYKTFQGTSLGLVRRRSETESDF